MTNIILYKTVPRKNHNFGFRVYEILDGSDKGKYLVVWIVYFPAYGYMVGPVSQYPGSVSERGFNGSKKISVKGAERDEEVLAHSLVTKCKLVSERPKEIVIDPLDRFSNLLEEI